MITQKAPVEVFFVAKRFYILRGRPDLPLRGINFSSGHSKKPKPDHKGRVLDFAGTTGLEPATYCVTGSRSNQLSYAPIFFLL